MCLDSFCTHTSQLSASICSKSHQNRNLDRRWIVLLNGNWEWVRATYTCHSQHTFHRGEEQVEKPDSNQSMYRGSQSGPAPEMGPISNKVSSLCFVLILVCLWNKRRLKIKSPDYTVSKTDDEHQDSGKRSFKRGEQLGKYHSTLNCWQQIKMEITAARDRRCNKT